MIRRTGQVRYGRRRGRAGRTLALALLGLHFGGGLGCSTTKGPDPWEPMNRGTFAFNEAADRWVVEPVAKGWDFVLPEVVETAIDHFFENTRAPMHIANNLLQGEIEHGYLELWRFVLNTTVGIAGFIDVASKAGWPHHPQDFGLTLGHWGVPNGPYLVLPIFGASTVRDTAGLGADSAMGVYSYFVPIYVPIAARATDLLNKRAIYLEEIAQAREEAFDFYVFVRNAYLQNREHRLAGLTPEEAERKVEDSGSGDEEDLYYFGEDEEENESEEGNEGEDEDGGDGDDADE